MVTLTKANMTTALSEKVGLSPFEAKHFIEIFFEEIKLSLEKGEEVMLTGFGKFSLIDKAARPGRNPRTGEPYEINARRVVTFHPSGKLKASLPGLDADREES